MTSKILRADGVTELASIQTVTYHESVNADIDLRPGCVASNYIEVTCFGAQSDAPDVGEALTYYQVVGGTETLIGTFYAEPSIPTKNSYSFIAYDAVHKLDADFSAWLSAHQDDFPYTVKQLVEQACTISGVMLGTSAWDHSTMEVNAWYADGLTCRNILQYAAEIACKFVRCNTDGEIVFDWYKGAASGDTKTASGTIATFDDGADRVPLKSLTAQITPVQDLHGYDSPWPAGGRKNKLPNDATTSTIQGVTFTVNADKTITANGTSTGWIGLTVSTFTLPAGEYKLVSLVNPAYAYNYYLSLNKSGTAVARTSSNPNGVAFTLTEETTLVCKLLARPNNALSNLVCYPMIILATETDVSYLPYSNICPISGWTGLEGKRTGVNVWDEETESGYISSSGVPAANSDSLRSKNYCPCKGGETYHFVKPATYSTVPNICWYDATQTFISRSTSAEFPNITAPDNAMFFKLSMWAYGTTYNHDISINYPSTDQDYHAYSGESLSVNWQDTAGTVYGGTLDVTNGVLTVDRAIVDLGTLTWTYVDAVFNFRSYLDIGALPPDGIKIVPKAKCTIFRVADYESASITGGITVIFKSSAQAGKIWVNTNTFSDLATFNAAVSGQTLVYELSTPITYQLTAEQMDTLLVTNNIWATTGDVEVEYYPTLGRIYPSSGTDDSGDRFAYKQDGLTYDNYDTSAVARVAVHPVGEDEVAYYYPTNVTSGNTLNITNNALLYGASAENMTAIAQSIYTTMTAFGTYRPMSVEMFPNECPFRCGDIVPVTDAQGVSFTTAIMEKTVTDSAVTFTSIGREVYGDYALDTAKQLVQLAADIVRINKLKVDWAEIGTAVIGVLNDEGITAAKLNGANQEEQLVYISKVSGTTTQSKPSSWVTNTTGNQNTWTLKRPVYNSSFPVLFVATQRKAVDGTVTCTTPAIDQTTTVIDGGHITTGTIDASRVNVTNINASNINTGALTVRDASNNIIFQADASNKNVQVGGWYANKDYIYSSNSNTDINSLYVGRGQIIFKDPNGNAKKDIVIDASKEYVSGKWQNRIDTALYDVYEDDSSVSSKYSIGCVINDLYAPHFSIGSHFDGSNITSDIYFDADTVTIMNPSAWRTALKTLMYYTGQAVNATSGTIMRIPASGTLSEITTDTVVLECNFTDPVNVISDVTWTSYNGYITFTGTCTAATTANVVLGNKSN